VSELLSIAALDIGFRDGDAVNPAVIGFDMSLARGETVGLVGESGSGKSSVALAIPRLLPPSARVAGRIVFDGAEMLTSSERSLRAVRGGRIGMIFQEPMSSLHPMQTVGAQIGEGLRLHRGLGRRAARARAIELLGEVGIDRPDRCVDRHPHQLSGGQRQRVMIAQAIAAEPALLIADEPTTALDATTQRQVLHLLRSLQQRLGVGLLLISHDLAMVGDVADRLLVMRRGRVVEQGRAGDVLASPQHWYTQGLLAARPRPRSQCHRLPSASGPPVGAASAATGTSEPGRGLQEGRSPLKRLLQKSGPLLEVRDLVVVHRPAAHWFGTEPAVRPAVDRVSFTLARGRTLGLLGESGSGKTTLGRALLRLIEPSSGSVRLDGIDVLAQQGEALRRLRKRMQIVFQDPVASLNPRLTLQDTLIEPLRLHRIGAPGEYQERAAELLRRVGLDPGWLGRYPHALSGGQRQRVGIARALAVEPELIVCDESVSALDVSVQAQILNLLRDLQDDSGLGYLFITHDVGVVRYMADDIAVMRGGRLLEIGPAEQVCAAPEHAYTRELLASAGTRRSL